MANMSNKEARELIIDVLKQLQMTEIDDRLIYGTDSFIEALIVGVAALATVETLIEIRNQAISVVADTDEDRANQINAMIERLVEVK